MRQAHGHGTDGHGRRPFGHGIGTLDALAKMDKHSPRHAKPGVHKSGAALTSSSLPGPSSSVPATPRHHILPHNGPQNTRNCGAPGGHRRRLPRLPPSLQTPHHHSHPNQPQLPLLDPRRMDLWPAPRPPAHPRPLVPHASHLRRPPALRHRIPCASPPSPLPPKTNPT